MIQLFNEVGQLAQQVYGDRVSAIDAVESASGATPVVEISASPTLDRNDVIVIGLVLLAALFLLRA